MRTSALLSVGVLAATVLLTGGCAVHSEATEGTHSPSASASTGTGPGSGTPSESPSASQTPSNSPIVQLPLPETKVPLPAGAITGLPKGGNYMAWTVDDGSDPDVVEKYVDFAQRTGTRLTFFINGQYPSWERVADKLRPMVQSGQIQIGNHTWDHPALTKISDQQIRDELTKNDEFIEKTFGVSAKPYYRPPFGYRNAHTDAVAASVGYTVPVLWYGSLSDSGLITPDQVVSFADQWFLPGHIVIGHANHPPVTEVFDQLEKIVQDRGLRTVTLRDIYQG
ncbi:peptidoglycan/xylan/chitin deacetylase (PgdA/CDA1 family) [Mycetocola sp. BIGb0189]|uniref:polysaccharide deacetylase family protein n=1 Tax=Mycetocola sp. BIGb0189 TaxID=2940604 RepID=UPI0021699AE5|nr:polysaccharide deacetylase family protein [Mycetocola sp. BIGb0189]MCS4276236.1 peptidoglycan/xylan/chitin deacetylase (PgdA/CDA1 family) [Mycetocola sp. BIGb0189]